jgi:NADH-quinone oxidoreductase subunit L
MGGIWKMVPVTYGLMWIGSLALAGIPPFAGFYSKDIVLEAAYAAATPWGHYAFVMGLAAAFLTAFYSWRLLLMTFHGRPRADDKVMAHVHESPMVMIAPLLGLAAGAAFAGLIAYDYFVGEKMASFWGETLKVLPAHDALAEAQDVPAWVKLSPLVVAGAGIALACVLYLLAPSLPAVLAERYPRLYRFLLNKWYFDELYDRLFVRPALVLGRNLWKTGAGTLIDGLGTDGLSQAVLNTARRVAAPSPAMPSAAETPPQRPRLPPFA